VRRARPTALQPGAEFVRVDLKSVTALYSEIKERSARCKNIVGTAAAGQPDVASQLANDRALIAAAAARLEELCNAKSCYWINDLESDGDGHDRVCAARKLFGFLER
jgi:hypothetical protein